MAQFTISLLNNICELHASCHCLDSIKFSEIWKKNLILAILKGKFFHLNCWDKNNMNRNKKTEYSRTHTSLLAVRDIAATIGSPNHTVRTLRRGVRITAVVFLQIVWSPQGSCWHQYLTYNVQSCAIRKTIGKCWNFSQHTVLHKLMEAWWHGVV